MLNGGIFWLDFFSWDLRLNRRISFKSSLMSVLVLNVDFGWTAMSSQKKKDFIRMKRKNSKSFFFFIFEAYRQLRGFSKVTFVVIFDWQIIAFEDVYEKIFTHPLKKICPFFCYNGLRQNNAFRPAWVILVITSINLTRKIGLMF